MNADLIVTLEFMPPSCGRLAKRAFGPPAPGSSMSVSREDGLEETV
jgi:hypothetical protein